MALTFFTIGHSTRSIGEFIELLFASEIDLVVDVRKVPRSRTNPHIIVKRCPLHCPVLRSLMRVFAELGGLRPRSRDIAPTVNGFWKNQSFHNYADYAMGAGFQFGFARLRELGSVRRCAVMCAEAVWWRCHRRIIAYLLIAGDRVFHILGPKSVTPASLTKGATSQPGGVLTYPANITAVTGERDARNVRFGSKA